jgi:L-threonylcarbamoyladenylate synthase
VKRGTDIAYAADVLRRGGLVVFPTETVYGLGADASSPAAVLRVFDVKGRPREHPLIVHLAEGADLEQWAPRVPAAARVLAEAFWPGPLTMILQRGARIAAEAAGGGDTIGLRMPAHPVAKQLLAAFGGAVAAPSANRFGRVSPTTADHVAHDLGDAVDYILDGGSCEVGVESTIVDISGSSGALPVLLRPGGVPAEELERVLGVRLDMPANSPIRVSGSLPSHYATHARVVAVRPDGLAGAIARERGWKIGILGLRAALVGISHPPGTEVMTLPDDLDEAARLLYASLRELDAGGADVIIAVLPPEVGLGAAIADRLRRAAGPRSTTEGP